MATIVTKNSSTASAVPTTSDLVQGELAVNVTDKRIFTENASTQIVELGTNPSSITTATATVTGTLTANGTFASSNAVLTGGTVNGIVIGGSTPQSITGTTVTASTGFVGGLTGNVTGNLTGNVTGNVAGNLTGNVTGNVTASSGTTTLNDLVVNGTADFTNTKLTNITTPTVGSDAANKSYVDDTVAAVIDSAPAALDTLNELAAALGDDANFAGTVTTALATKLPLAGGTMTGAIAMGTSKITGLGNPTSAQDAATKTYVDTADALKLNLTGGTMSGAIAMGTNKITGVGNPTLAQDAATKDYVDDILGSATSAATSAAAAATSASNAATSASNAATSATASSNSAAAAAASYDAFDDRYLGDKASDPTLDNDGNALLTGALYFNTTSDVMKVYDGSAWNIAAISSASPTFTGTVTADGLSLGDNDKATFGAGNDLEIYYDGSNSYILNTAPYMLIESGTIVLRNTAGTEDYAKFNENSDVTLYFNNNLKFATTNTGIDVTGTATMDGLTVDGSSTIAINSSSVDSLKVKRTEIGGGVRLKLENGDSNYYQLQNNGAEFFSIDYNGANRLGIANNGDISFYEDTGTTPKFFWDASAESLGIGTTSPFFTVAGRSSLSVNGTSSSILAFGKGGSSENYILADAGGFTIANTSATLPTTFFNNASNSMTIDSSGNVGIGTSSPAYLVDAYGAVASRGSGAGNAAFVLQEVGNNPWYLTQFTGGSFSISYNGTSSANSTLSIDASGNVGIGTTSPAVQVQLGDGTATSQWIRAFGSVSDIYVGQNTSITHFGLTNASKILSTTGNPFALGTTASQPIVFGTNNTERMRIDSSGNLLVGTTSPVGFLNSTSETGSISYSIGLIAATASNDSAAYFKRLTNDGSIITFRNSSAATVGNIGVHTTQLYVGTGDTGLYFNAGNDSIDPYNTSTPIARSDAISLGAASRKFKDLYLSGGVYLGGTGAANKLDDYEEGTWTPVFDVESGTNPTYTVTNAYYVKIGDFVYATAKLNVTVVGAGLLRGSFPVTPLASDSYSGNSRMADSSGNWRNLSVGHYSTVRCLFTFDGGTTTTYYVNANQIGTGSFVYSLSYRAA